MDRVSDLDLHRKAILTAVVVIGLLGGVMMALLLAITGSTSQLDDMDPALFQLLVKVFS